MKKTLISTALLSFTAWLPAADLVLPWVTNNVNFRTTVAINNLNNQSVQITLRAARATGAAGTLNDEVTVDIPAFSQLVQDAGMLFPNMGEGSGYLIRLTSPADNITAGFVVSATSTASGNSPAQANAVAFSSANTIINYPLVPLLAGGFSAPVILNLGTTDAQVTFHAFKDGKKEGEAMRTVGANRPFAEGANTLFPGVSGNIYVVAESTVPLTGVTFIFNDLGEPSMANAQAISAVPDPNGNMQATVSFATDVQAIFNQSCGNGICHLDGSASSNLRLDADVSYNAIVGVSAVQSNLNLIQPSDPDNSYLFLRLFDGNGTRMPRGRPALSDEDIGKIRTWIEQGAQNN